MGSDKKQVKEVKGENFKAEKKERIAMPAIVEEIAGRTGFRGEITQVKCRIIDGYEQGKQLRRNVKGPIQIKDLLMLRETDIEARPIRSKVTKGAFS
jgi:small subunit ribosomal protein S28e